MTSDQRSAYVTRETILKMLSNDEVAKVSMAETAARLPEGDEYLDLEELAKGVQRARGTTTHMAHVLSRKSVHPDTWTKIVALLATPRS